MKNNNQKVLDDLVAFCNSRKDLRFWQAVYAWLGVAGVGGIEINGEDPFHWEGKLK